MNSLIIILEHLLKSLHKHIAIKSNNTEYTYEYILNASRNLANNLNDIAVRKINIALIANNSVEWIIIFLGVLFSKHHLILFSPNLSKNKIYHILQVTHCRMLITDINDLQRSKLTTVFDIIIINQMDFDGINSSEVENFNDFNDIDGLTVCSPRSLYKVFISFNEITDLLRTLERKEIFERCSNYVVYQEFTYNYIMCLLLPMLFGVPIVIPKEPKTAYSLRFSLLEQRTEVVVLTGYQFENLWREYIENEADIFTEFLRDFNFKKIRRWRIKRHLKKLFPNINQLIILNSSISIEKEVMLTRINFPYTITYGTIETCGIAAYSDPKNFKLGSVGETLSENLKEVNTNLLYLKPLEDGNWQTNHLDDIGSINDKIVRYECHKDELIPTNYGVVNPREVEKILKSISPLVVDCVYTYYNEQFVLLVYVDSNYADYKGLKLHDIYEIIERNVQIINSNIETFERINKVCVYLNDFNRDSYGRILREYYISR